MINTNLIANHQSCKTPNNSRRGFLWFLFLFALVFGFHFDAYSQREAAGISRSKPKTPAGTAKMTVTSLLYFGGDGQGIRTCLLKTAHGVIEFSVTKRTKALNFPELDDVGWNLGAEWRVTYHKSKDLALGFEADSITYLNTNHLIDSAYNSAREYLAALSAEPPNYKEAYAKLNSALQKRLNFTDFEAMYSDVELDSKSIRVCSHNGGKVVLMLAYTGELAHRVEVAESEFDYQINRFFNWSETLEKEEALCRKQL